MSKYLSESRITNNFLSAVTALRIQGLANCYAVKFPGTMLTSGQPDVIGLEDGHMFAIEFKSPSARGRAAEPTARQRNTLKLWSQAGASTGVATSVTEAMEIAGLLEAYQSIAPRVRQHEEKKEDVARAKREAERGF